PQPTSASLSFTAPSTTEIYTLSLHDALPICAAPAVELCDGAGLCQERKNASPDGLQGMLVARRQRGTGCIVKAACFGRARASQRSEEHTSELQSRENLVCRLLLEKKNKHETA